MHKIILTLLMTILSTPAANAQNCVNSSRCDELGYTKTTADCAGLDTLVCPFDENKVFCVFSEQDCEIGDILYENKKCYGKAPDGKTAIGVVFDAGNRLAVALDEKKLAWGDTSYKAAMEYCQYSSGAISTSGCNSSIAISSCAPSGKDNTMAIIAVVDSEKEYPAAEYCNSYSTIGTKAGEWFLPSIAELLQLSNNYAVVNIKLTALNKTLISDNNYWSSLEKSVSEAWIQNPSSCRATTTGKYYEHSVRPVLAF